MFAIAAIKGIAPFFGDPVKGIGSLIRRLFADYFIVDFKYDLITIAQNNYSFGRSLRGPPVGNEYYRVVFSIPAIFLLGST